MRYPVNAYVDRMANSWYAGTKNVFHQEGPMPFHLNHDGQTTPARPSNSTDTNPLLEQALKERERFLKQCPHMTAYQQEIDRILDKSGTSRERMAVLEIMLQGKLLDIQEALCQATAIFTEAFGG